MMRTYFTANIPDAVAEAARVDGASEFRILFGVVMPMTLPIIATIGLLVGLAYWNDWMNGLYYLNDDRMFSIQVLLMNIQRDLDSLRQQAQAGGSVKGWSCHGRNKSASRMDKAKHYPNQPAIKQQYRQRYY